eukprot:gene24930-31328_t
MCLSAAASFSGAMSVVLTSLGKISCFFWGIINCFLYGLYSFAYGYAGDAQLNIMFLLPMQFVEPLLHKQLTGRSPQGPTSTTTATTAAAAITTRSLSSSQRIPEFAKALTGSYLFQHKPLPRLLDSLSNGLSIMAQTLLLMRCWESWVLWLAVNVIQIAMFAGVAGSGVDFNMLVMLSLFMVNACYGLNLWYGLAHCSVAATYGTPYSQFMRCEHILVDLKRVTVPVSGTSVRGDGVKMWEYISKPLRSFYAPRFVLVGSESVGKSTLTAKLAAHFSTVYVEDVRNMNFNKNASFNMIVTTQLPNVMVV